MSRNTEVSGYAYINAPSPAKLTESAEHAAAVEAFLAAGGKIQEIPPGVGQDTPIPFSQSLGSLESKRKRRGEWTVNLKRAETLPPREPKKRGGGHNKPVLIIHGKGVGAWYPSAKIASLDLGASSNAVTTALRRGGRIKGFKVEYARAA